MQCTLKKKKKILCELLNVRENVEVVKSQTAFFLYIQNLLIKHHM